MTKIALLFAMFIIISACEKADPVSPDPVNPDFIGKWEAAYSIRSNSDTMFYKEGTDFACAYVVIPGEYNSGFEFTDEANGELIWCGTNKGQFFSWSYEKDVMKFNFLSKEHEFPIERLAENAMFITVDGEKFYMKKF